MVGARSSFDHCCTPMGTRLLRKWVLMPLLDKMEIQLRHNVVYFLTERTAEAQEMTALLKQIGDLERLISKSAMGKIQPREV